MTWQPTIGTLSAEDLASAIQVVRATVQTYMDLSLVEYGEPDLDLIVAHIDALTAQLERARGIAVSLEQELAQRGAGTWPMRQYATVELPDEAADKAGVE